MAGGTFTLAGKKDRPGTYVNLKSQKKTLLAGARNGTVILPLIKHNYGPAQEFIEITAAAPDDGFEKLGYSIYDNDPNQNMLRIRETLKGAEKVVVFIPTEGKKASAEVSGMTCTAKYGGSLGNDLKVSVVDNAELGEGFFNVVVTLGAATVETMTGMKTIGDVIAHGCAWLNVTGESATALQAASAVSLTGGEDGAMNNADFTNMVDKAESMDFKVFAFPYSSETYGALCAAIKSKVEFMNNGAGKRVKAVMAAYASDYEQCLNVTNGVVLEDDTEITKELAVCFIAGITASASYTQSNTYRAYPGAKSVLKPKNHDEAVAAIRAGEIFFSYNNAYEVVVEYDINSLTTITSDKDESYKKNRVMRVFDAFIEALNANFPPNKYDNSETGWAVMEGVGRSLLELFEKDGAIDEVDYEADFQVDRKLSEGDKTFFNVGLKAVDSAEKLFFTVNTR